MLTTNRYFDLIGIASPIDGGANGTLAIVRSCPSLAFKKAARKIGVPASAAKGFPMDLGLKDCKAFVAGASKGLGKACAKALAGEGARVFLCSRNVGELKRAAAEIGATGYAAADVSRPDEVKRVVVEAIAALGGLDCLVTNAGGPPTAQFEKADDGDWDIAYQLNLMSAVRLIREALSALKASGRGRIVNLTGYGVKEPMTDLVVSDSVRAGVTVMAKTIASDLAPFGITVNNIAPGKPSWSTAASTAPFRPLHYFASTCASARIMSSISASPLVRGDAAMC